MKKCIPVLLMLTILICGCSKQAQESTSEPVSDTFFAMDTTMDFRIYGDKSLLQDAQNVITDLEKKVSVTDSDSEIYKINENGSGILSGEADTLMKNALEMCRRTNGALDISIYPIVKTWGFTTGSYQVPDEETIQTLLTKVDYTQIQYDEASGNVTIPEGMTIDLGSIAKGYAGELAARTLRDPKNPDTAMMGLSVTDQAVVTSGGYERYFEQDGHTYWHIMDPATGHPAKSGLLSVTVVGDKGGICDALSTSLFVMGLDKAYDLWAESDDFEAVFVATDGTVYITDGLKDIFSLAQGYEDTSVKILTR